MDDEGRLRVRVYSAGTYRPLRQRVDRIKGGETTIDRADSSEIPIIRSFRRDKRGKGPPLSKEWANHWGVVSFVGVSQG